MNLIKMHLYRRHFNKSTQEKNGDSDQKRVLRFRPVPHQRDHYGRFLPFIRLLARHVLHIMGERVILLTASIGLYSKFEFCKSKYAQRLKRVRNLSTTTKASYLNSPVTNVQENV